MKPLLSKIQQIVKSHLATALLFLFVTLMLTIQNAKASRDKETPVTRKELKFENQFQTVNIEGDVTVIFTNEPIGSIAIEGQERHLDKVRYILEDNKLTIDVNQIADFKKITVYLSAIALQHFQMNGNADISSFGTLNTNQMHLYLNGNISLKIRTTGQLFFDSPDDIELTKRSKVLLKPRAF